MKKNRKEKRKKGKKQNQNERKEKMEKKKREGEKKKIISCMQKLNFFGSFMIKKEEEGDEDVTLLLRIDFSVQDSQQVVDIIFCVRSRFLSYTPITQPC